jgi:hypothetical protein
MNETDIESCLKQNIDFINHISVDDMINYDDDKSIDFDDNWKITIHIYDENIPNFDSLTYREDITYFDLFGFCSEYKKMFSELEQFTDCSTEEILHVLRKEKNVTVYSDFIEFGFTY